MNRLFALLSLRRWRPNQSTSLSLRGAFFLFATTLLGLASVDAGINLLLMVFGLCLSACIVSAFVGWHSLRRLSVKRTIPDAVTAAAPFEIRYTVKNNARWGTARCIHLVDLRGRDPILSAPEAFIPVLRPGESIIVTAPAAARSRGRIHFDEIRLMTGFPFGIFTKSVFRHQPQELVVFPRLTRLLAQIEPVARSIEVAHAGATQGSVRGDEEFYGIREYRIGDNPRRIHWRRSARTGRLMVREMARPRDHKFWCVVNTRINPRDSADANRLEAAISAAATTICDALEKGVKVGLICGGEPLLVLPPGGGRAHRPRLLRELALRTRNIDEDLTGQVRRIAWPHRWRGNCLLFAASDGEDVRAAARALNLAIGPTTVYVPGSQAFENQYFVTDDAVTLPRRQPSVN